MGPRRKMTALIARWHSNAPLRGTTRESVYADKLHVEMQQLTATLTTTAKDNKLLQKQVSEHSLLIVINYKIRSLFDNPEYEG